MNNIYISACDITENAKLNHEITEELRKYTPASLENKGSKFSSKLALNRKRMGLNKTVCLLTLFTLFPALAHAESCIATPKCEDLGYTETSCPDDKGVRCPWNTSLWHCDSGQKCSDLGFKYTCTETGYAGGISTTCDGKYNVCSCAAGYAWDTSSSSCKFQTGLKDGLYYCNGVVKGVQVGSESLVVALRNLDSMTWSSASTGCSEYSFCGDTKGVLPTIKQLLTIYNNISTVQSRLSANGGTQFYSDYYWSSSPYPGAKDNYYCYNPVSRTTDWGHNGYRYVRCVLAF